MQQSKKSTVVSADLRPPNKIVKNDLRHHFQFSCLLLTFPSSALHVMLTEVTYEATDSEGNVMDGLVNELQAALSPLNPIDRR